MTWECITCTFQNDEDQALQCEMCGKPNPLAPAVVNGWECACGQRNPEFWQQCTCKNMKPGEEGEVTCGHCGATNNSIVLACTTCEMRILKPEGWTCRRCTLRVAEGETECTTCAAGKDGNDAKRRKLRKRNPAKPAMDEDEVADSECFGCSDGGSLVMCDHKGCPRAYHAECIPVPAGQPPLTEYTLPSGQWFCPAHNAAPAEGEADGAAPAEDGPAPPGPVAPDAAAAQAVAAAAAATEEAAAKAASVDAAAAAAAKTAAAAAIQTWNKAEADAARSKAAAAEAANAAKAAATAIAAAKVEAAASATAAKATVADAATAAEAAAAAAAAAGVGAAATAARTATAAEAAAAAAAQASANESTTGVANVSMHLVAPGGREYCNCAGVWTLPERRRCLAQQSDAYWCDCADGGTPGCNARRQLLDSKCIECRSTLHEVWRFREPTSTIMRFMMNRFMTDDTWPQDAMAEICDRVSMQAEHPAVLSGYSWALTPGNPRSGYCIDSMAGRSYEAARWVNYIVRSMREDNGLPGSLATRMVLAQARSQKMLAGEHVAPRVTAAYVCGSAFNGTCGMLHDRINGHLRCHPHRCKCAGKCVCPDMQRWLRGHKAKHETNGWCHGKVHNRCSSDRACSCECAMERAVTEFEQELDVGFSAEPEASPGEGPDNDPNGAQDGAPGAGPGSCPGGNDKADDTAVGITVSTANGAAAGGAARMPYDMVQRIQIAGNESWVGPRDLGVISRCIGRYSHGRRQQGVARMLRRWVLIQPRREICDEDKMDLVHVFDVLLSILENMHSRSDIESSTGLASALLADDNKRCCGRSMGTALLMITRLETMLRNYSSMRAHRRRRHEAAVRSRVCRQWREANSAIILKIEERAVSAYALCGKFVKLYTMVTTYHGLGLSTSSHMSAHQAVYLTDISSCLAGVWCGSKFGGAFHMVWLHQCPAPRPMTSVELGVAISQANNWTSASYSVMKLSVGAQVDCEYTRATGKSRMYVVTITALAKRSVSVKYSDGSVERGVARGRLRQLRKRPKPKPLRRSARQRQLQQKPLRKAVVLCKPMNCGLPPVSMSNDILVCWEVSKGWYLRAKSSITADIPRGTCVGMYPLTIKMQPAWAQAHHAEGEIAQQNNFLMPVYAKNKAGCAYRIDELVGDVSAVAPLHSDGVPCVAHLCNEAMIRSAVNVEYIHSTQGKLEPGTERMYKLRTVKPVSAGTELLADYGAKFPRTWSGLYRPKK